MKAYGIPVQPSTFAWKPATAASPLLNGAAAAAAAPKAPAAAVPTVAAAAAPAVATTIRGITVAAAAANGLNVVASGRAAKLAAAATAATTTTTVNSRLRAPSSPAPPVVDPMMEAAVHLSSKQLEDLMDDDCGGPVSNGDPMLSSPHLSPYGVMSSPASSSHYSDALSPADSMDLAA